MKILNFTAVEILPALLNRSKCQTIRPAFKKTECAFCHKKGTWGDFEVIDKNRDDVWVYCNIAESKVHNKDVHAQRRFVPDDYPRKIMECDDYLFEKPAGFEVGDEVEICWKSRGTPESAEFCSSDGELLKENVPYGHKIEYFRTFPKILGAATITAAFKIEMWKRAVIIGSSMSIGNTAQNNGLAVKDGFKNAEKMFKWFGSHYNLEIPKKFHVYRWRWD